MGLTILFSLFPTDRYPKMLSAPVKSAKRISSLFSLGSNKDASTPSPPRSPSVPKLSPDQMPQDKRRRSSSRPARLASNPVPNFSQPMSPIARDNDLDLDSPLPPPPSLLAVNQDLADSAPNSPDGRPQSRGRRLSSSRPSSSAGLAVPGSGPDSRPGTPSKRRSWMPGRARASSIDARASPQQLPGAWIAGLEHKIPYDMGPLGRGEQVCNLFSRSASIQATKLLLPQTLLDSS
jgi:hypothetical protein